jgi:nitrite reductase/ring-hydroxylating ferredoxin subunit
MAFQPIGKLADFPEGRGVEVRLGARRIAVYRLGGELFALKNICPHAGDSLHELPPVGGAAVCRGHGWRFDLRSGRCVKGSPEARVAVYPVRLEGESVLIDLG